MSNRLPVGLPFAGPGSILAVPAGTANGTPITGRPGDAQAINFILGGGDSVTLCLATLAQGQPTTAPAAVNCITLAGLSGQAGDIEVPFFFAATTALYVTASTTGSAAGPRMRWM